MTLLAIIGGSGLTSLNGLEIKGEKMPETPYGQPSGLLTFGIFSGKDVVFLARHGDPHVFPPHKINYQANIWALKDNDVSKIIGVNAVGGITGDMHPCRLVIPDQLIDYTWGRTHTFLQGDDDHVMHIDFTYPYCDSLRQILIETAKDKDIKIVAGGTYAASQGPRLETAAEIKRMERDCCDLVGMTGMPEAALACELDLEYASICVVANWAPGISNEEISMELISENLKKGVEKARLLLEMVIPKI